MSQVSVSSHTIGAYGGQTRVRTPRIPNCCGEKIIEKISKSEPNTSRNDYED